MADHHLAVPSIFLAFFCASTYRPVQFQFQTTFVLAEVKPDESDQHNISVHV
jgi:hypothetical protein